MRHRRMPILFSILPVLGVLLCAAGSENRGDRGVSGIVRMPDICSPSVSPAVVYLVPSDSREQTTAPKHASMHALTGRSGPAEVVLINQRGLQFVPRVQAIALGQAIRFTNEDGETHNVHVVSPGFAFNQSMSPGQFRDFTPAQPGVMRLACDIHMHMRAFVVISPSPWVQVCDREGRYRLDGVPEGRYILTAWHEMGDPVQREITVAAEKGTKLPDLVLSSSLAPGGLAGQEAAPVRPWADVIDGIGVTLAASRDAATRPGRGRQGSTAGRRRLLGRI